MNLYEVKKKIERLSENTGKKDYEIDTNVLDVVVIQDKISIITL